MRLQRQTSLPCLVLTWLALGCGDDEGPQGTECVSDPTPSARQATSESVEVGFVTVQDVRDRTKDDDGMVRSLDQGRIQAGFGDFSEVTRIPAQQIDFGPYCVGLTSLSQTMGERIALSPGTLSVQGTARGEIMPTQTSTGVFIDVGGFVVPPEGNLQVSAGADTFVAFDANVAGLQPMQLLSPSSDGSAVLEEAPLDIEWTPGNGDWIDLAFTPEQDQNMPNAGGQVFCRVADVGCFQLPVSAVLFLLSNNRPSFTLSVERVRYAPLALEDRAFVEIEVKSEWKTTLDNSLFE